MFNIGGGEFLVIALLALLILGPDKLPEAYRKLGETVAEFKKLSNGFKAEMKSAMDVQSSVIPSADVPTVVDSAPTPEAQATEPTAPATPDDSAPSAPEASGNTSS